jgi:hypothetical protein
MSFVGIDLEPQGWRLFFLPPSHLACCGKLEIMCIQFNLLHLKHYTKYHFGTLISYYDFVQMTRLKFKLKVFPIMHTNIFFSS